jgi:preprotein translocase subunit SecE
MRERVLDFFREVRGEFRRITWPSRPEVIGLTALVLLIIVLLSIYVGLLDFIFQVLVKYLLGR